MQESTEVPRPEPESDSSPSSADPGTLTKWLSPVEIGYMLGVTTKTVCGWLRDEGHPLKGKKFKTMWRVHPDAYKKYIEQEMQ